MAGLNMHPTVSWKTFFVLFALMPFSILSLGGCAGAYMQGGFTPLYTPSDQEDNLAANRGFSMLYRGDLLAAEAAFEEALGTNARDPYALVGKAITYENLGLIGQAREVYQEILTIGPDYSKRVLVMDGGMHTVPIVEYADVRLGYIDSHSQDQAYQGAIAKTIARDTLRGMNQTETTILSARTDMGGGDMGRSIPAAVTSMTSMNDVSENNDLVRRYGVDPAFANIMLRFQALKILLQEGLIPPQEYTQRRSQNLGALLPLTNTPPSANVEDPVPPTSSIIQRLRALGRALEIRSMSFQEHATEREAILDGLLPDTPVRLKPSAVPPKDLLEAATDIRRLEILRERDLISQAEMNRETQAIEGSLQRQGTPSPDSMSNNMNMSQTNQMPQQQGQAQQPMMMAQPPASGQGQMPQTPFASSLPFTPIQ